MAKDHLAHDFDGNPRSRRIRGGMPPQVMWPQFDPGQLPGVLDNDPCCSISDWENLVLRRYCLVLQIRPQTICNFSGNEHDLSVPAAFGALDHQFVVADIIRSELQDFAYSHAASCHQFQDKPVSHLRRPENDLIDRLFLNNFPVRGFSWTIDFPQHRGIARVLNGGVFNDNYSFL